MNGRARLLALALLLAGGAPLHAGMTGGGGGSTGQWDDISDPDANGTIVLGDYTTTWTSTLDGGSVLSVTGIDTDVSANTILIDLGSSDSSDPNGIFLRARSAVSGTPTTIFQVAQDLITFGTTTEYTNSSGGGTAGNFSVFEAPNDGNESFKLQSQAMTGDAVASTADWTFTWPANDGDTGQYLSTDGSGVLSWATLATISSACPALVLEDSTAGHDDWELDGCSDEFNIWNKTTSTVAVKFTETGAVKFPILNAASCDVKADTMGRIYCGTDATGAGGGDAITVNASAATDPDFLNGDIDWTLTGGNSITATVGCAGCVDTTDVDETTFDAVTWSDGANASNAWTMDVSGTDTDVTFGSDAWTINADSLDIQGAGPNITLDPDSGDSFGYHVDAGSSRAFILNETDGVHYLTFQPDHSIFYGTASVPFHRFLSNGTGDSEVQLPDDSIGLTELASDAWPPERVRIPLAAMLPLEPAESIPPISKDAGTNLDQLTVDFDQSTDECRTQLYVVHPNINASGDVTFTIDWYAASVTSGNVVWDVRHNSGVAAGVDPDQAVSTATAPVSAAQGTAGQITITSWTVTVSSLGWVAGDRVDFMVCRDANAAGDTFADDAKARMFTMHIPLSP